MAYGGNFSIFVRGNIIGPASAENFKNLVNKYVIKIDDESELNEGVFAGYVHTFRWAGIPKDMVAVANAKKEIRDVIDRFFSMWYYDIIIKLIEKEGG